MQENSPNGIRNNNPDNGDEWKALVPETKRTDRSFSQFTRPEYGIRVMVIIMRNYQIKYGVNTMSGIIQRWAPPNEKNIQAYIDGITQVVGAAAEKLIDLMYSRITILSVEAIIKHKNGQQPYSFDVFVRAVDLVG